MRYSLSWKQVTHRVVTIAHVWYSWHENECVSSANHCISVSGIVGTWLPKPWPVARCAEDVPGQVPYRLSTGWQFWRSLRLQRIPGAVKILLGRCIQFIKNGQQAFVLADAWQQGNEHDQQDSWLSAARNHLNQRPFLQPDKMCFFRTSHFSTSVCAFQNTLQTASDFSFFFRYTGRSAWRNTSPAWWPTTNIARHPSSNAPGMWNSETWRWMMMMMGECFLLGIKQTPGHNLPKFSNVCLAMIG